ncbi:MAG: NlpC/P60 family protein, partial [Candidatus Thorarchaeota archaeon]
MDIEQERRRVIQIAESWIGTPFRWNACEKGVGCDCSHLMLGVFRECGCAQNSQPVYHTPASSHRFGISSHIIPIMRNFSVRHPFFSLRRLRPADVLVFCLKDTAVHTALYIGGKYQEFIQCLEDPGYVSVEGFHGDKKGLRAR